LRRREQQLRIHRGENDRERPLPTFRYVLGRLSRVEPRIRIHFLQEPSAAVVLFGIAPVVCAGGVYGGVEPIGGDVAPLATPRPPTRRLSAAAPSPRGPPTAPPRPAVCPLGRRARRRPRRVRRRPRRGCSACRAWSCPAARRRRDTECASW